MPRYYREEPEEAADYEDYRPAFNRPPGAKPAAAANDSPRTPKRSSRDKAKQSPAVSPQKKSGNSGARRKSSGAVKSTPTKDRAKYNSSTSAGDHSHNLSVDSLSKLNELNARASAEEKKAERKRKEKQYKNVRAVAGAQTKHRKKNRNVSGAVLEEGRWNEKHAQARRRGGAGYVRDYEQRRRTASNESTSKRVWIVIGIIVLLLVIFIPVGVVLSNKKSSGPSSNLGSGAANGTNLPDRSTIPAAAQNTILDPYTWYDTTDFNTTYTNDTVGGLPVMGLFTAWDDSASANSNTPPLTSTWKYGQTPIRGVNLGGWLSIEPFITPSLFNTYQASDNIVDEYTLSTILGPSAKTVIEKHYATFITEQDFSDIANAGLDHVRIPYPYWAVTTYDGDPYVPKVAWRYLLRGIEYARKYGLRVNLDLHSLPGSQNGWNHSGRQGSIGWILGPDGSLNEQRSLDIHNQLSQFFAQDRYKNVVAFYGLVNEPKMLEIPIQEVIDWNTKAVQMIRSNGMTQHIVFGDGFLALNQWDQMFKNVDSGLVMDTHQYEIFNVGQLNLTHQNKINVACSSWSSLMSTASNPSTG
jgi:glucan 1,3-beta-glucosidase